MPRATSVADDRAHLRLIRADHDQRVAHAVEAVRTADRMYGLTDGELQEYPDKTGRGPTLFRFTAEDGVQSAHSIPHDRLTEHVRTKLWELVEAIDDAGRL